MSEDMIVHGVEWTVKQLFVYPNEYIYWSIQIVMYPYMTGLVAGAFVLSSLYHVFGQKDLKDIAHGAIAASLAAADEGLGAAAHTTFHFRHCGIRDRDYSLWAHRHG